MPKQIIHGIGKGIFKSFKDPSKIITMTDMQDLTIESTSSSDDITGGNKLFPIASFKTDQSLTISGTNATFDLDMLPFLEGTKAVVGTKTLTDFLEVAIPEDGVITIDDTPIEGTVTVATKGFAVSASGEPAAGQYKVEAKTVTFNTADAGKVVTIVYDFKSTAEAVSHSVDETTKPEPFVFDYIFPIYDEDTQITHKGYFKVFKAQCTSGLSINVQHQAAFAPTFEASARDAKRADKKLWDLTIDGVSILD